MASCHDFGINLNLNESSTVPGGVVQIQNDLVQIQICLARCWDLYFPSTVGRGPGTLYVGAQTLNDRCVGAQTLNDLRGGADSQRSLRGIR